MRAFPDPGTMGAKRECLYFLDGTGDLYALVRMACLDADGPRWDLERVLSMADRLGAFDPEPAEPVRAVGFLTAEFLPWYYRTGACFEKEEASRGIAGLVGIPVEQVREILQKLLTERPPPVTHPQTDADNDVTTDVFQIPYP